MKTKKLIFSEAFFTEQIDSADRFGGATVGVRHFAGLVCRCEICVTDVVI
jgi:hypothetical protein